MKVRTKDSVSKSYFSNPERFAQVCNNELFGGEKMIRPEYLKNLDTAEFKTMGLERREVEAVWKNRDILKVYGDEMILAVLGIENQNEVHYAMPLRNMLYDVLNYEAQRSVLQKQHRIRKDLNQERYVSGMSETDRLIPVFTLVIYYGEKPWDGPRNLQDMLDIPKELEQYRDKIADYRINLLDIHSMEDLENYSGELKALLGFIKYQNDKTAFADFIRQNHEIYRRLSPETVQAVSVLGNISQLEIFFETEQEDKEELNMCRAFDEMLEDKFQEGIAAGKKAGIKAGIEAGIETGIRVLIENNLEFGISEQRILEILQKKFSLTAEKAADCFRQYSK